MPLGNSSSDFIHSESNQDDHIQGFCYRIRNPQEKTEFLKIQITKLLKKLSQ
jgi:hypothetical protein